MFSVLVLTLLVLAQAAPPGGGGSGFGAPPELYTIDGYLERAPKDAKVLYTAEIAVGQRQRNLLITAYWRVGTGNRAELVREIGRFHPDFLLQGPPGDLASIVDAPPGTRIHGTFKFSRGGLPTLLITDLAIEPPQPSGAAEPSDRICRAAPAT